MEKVEGGVALVVANEGNPEVATLEVHMVDAVTVVKFIKILEFCFG